MNHQKEIEHHNLNNRISRIRNHIRNNKKDSCAKRACLIYVGKMNRNKRYLERLYLKTKNKCK